MNDQRIAPEWFSALEGIADPMLSSFAGVSVWASTTTFRTWPEIEPSAHEFNCRKGRSLLLGADGTMSAAEIEVTRSFRDSGWHAGWLATCGRRNPMWRTYMLAVTTPMVSILPDPLPLVPARIAAVLVRNGSAGYPDVVACRNERHPVFVELKGPGDTGTSQAKWLSAAIAKGDVTLDDFLLLSWTAEQ